MVNFPSLRLLKLLVYLMKNYTCPRGFFFAFTFLVLAAASPVILAAAPVVPTEGDLLVLPDLKVTGTQVLPKLEAWNYTKIEGFEVLSNASERNTKSMMADFAQFTQALRLIWPSASKPLATSSIILCGKGGEFDQFLPPGAGKDGGLVPSLFLRNREQVAIIVDVETDRVSVDNAAAQMDVSGVVEYEVDHYKQLYRAYVHYLLSQSEARVPAWVEEGLSQIVMDIEMTHDSLIYGKINSLQGAATGLDDPETSDVTTNGDSVVGERTFNVVLQHQKLMPLAQFFAVTSDSPEAKHPMGDNLWAKQAYAVVHFCLFGENLRHKESLGLYLQRLGREPVSEALFKDCFKISYADMEKQLRGYILHTKHKYQKYPLKAEDKFTAKSIELREATALEVGLMKGDALRLAGNVDKSIDSYRDAYLRGAREPVLLAALGVAEQAAGHSDRAQKMLEIATKAGASRPSAYVELASMRLAAAKAAPGSNGKLATAQMAAVLTPLFEARKHPPLLPETYELIADAWASSATAPTVDNLGVLDEGIRAFPRNSALLYNSAQLYHHAGATPTAASITRLGIRFSSTPADKARLEEFLASLPAPAKP